MSAISETERAAPGDKLRQGDIIGIDYPNGKNGPDFGVIINADCDLDHQKTDGVIAYVPLYPFRIYLSRFWAVSHVEQVVRGTMDRLVSLTKGGDTGCDDLLALIRTLSVDEVISRLKTLPGIKSRDHRTIEESVRKLHICVLHTVEPYKCFIDLCKLHNDPEKYARTQIDAAKKSMGDGHFFMSDVVGQPDLGFVVRMRRIYSIREDRVFTAIAAQRAGSQGDKVTAVRVARLTPLYRFRLLQVFAQQFSRIGLPDEITALSSLVIDDLVASATAEFP